MRRSGIKRRPRKTVCEACGIDMVLIDCGVDEHHKTRTYRERLDDRCPGHVYVHVETFGIDCPE